MIGNTEGRASPLTLPLVLLIVAAAGAASLVLLNSSMRDSLAAPQLLRDLSVIRPSGARLFRAPSPDGPDPEYQARLSEAQLAVLSMPESAMRQRVQALIHAGGKDWQKASTMLADLVQGEPNNAEVLNDLGVAYVALGEQNAIYYFKALQLFESAAKLSPNAPAPRFNIVLTYRITGLGEFERTAWTSYRDLETDARWVRALTPETVQSESELIDGLRSALEHQETARGRDLLTRHLDVYRHVATDYALNPDDPQHIDTMVQFIVAELRKNGDETIPAILAPLATPYRDQVIESRKHVHAGAEAYLQSKMPESIRLYEQARDALRGVDSPFDKLWIGLNQADSEIRMGDALAARQRLNDIIAEAREKHLTWLLGLALSSKGANPVLTQSFAEHSATLTEAVQVLREAGDARDMVRPFYYLGMSRLIAGDLEGSLQYAHEAVARMRPDDPMRRTELYRLSGLLLGQMGFPSHATSFLAQSLSAARQTGNLQAVMNALSYVGLIYESQRDHQAARKYMAEIRDLRAKVEGFRDRQLTDLMFNALCGRVGFGSHDFAEAEKCLQENSEILRGAGLKVPYYYSPLSQLAKVHSMMGRTDLARNEYRQAADVLEDNDDYFVNPQIRLSFENERRDLYDSAIAFEYDQGRMDEAWSYTQRYRSKLFLEFMGRINPAIVRIHTDAMARDRVQKLIPKDIQVMEYVLLPDRLLIWLVSDRVFTSKSVLISRTELARKVDDFTTRLRDQKDVSGLSQELHRWLIGPVEEALDPARTVVIIPDLALHRLPFAALQDPTTKDYLIARYAIVESPNLTHLLAALPKTDRQDSVVAFGAKTDDAAYAREFAVLGKIYPNIKTFVAERADKAAFLNAIENASVFHYAGHSRDASDPLQSSVLLDGTRDGPNNVTAFDISGRQMKANALVILASCDSSVGNSRDGIGIRGLTSAFLISGAGAVVGSLWDVEAAGTSNLITEFHKGLVRGRTPVVQALRQAQLAFLKSFPNKSHPYYWSGFVVTGNTTALRSSLQNPTRNPN